MYKYYSPIDDAIIFFTTKVNKTMTVADLSRTLHKNHPSLEKKLERVIKPALELEKKYEEAYARLKELDPAKKKEGGTK